jgi:hypothetical protein
MKSLFIAGSLLAIGLLAGLWWGRPTPVTAAVTVKDGSKIGYVNLLALDKRYRKMIALVGEARQKITASSQRLVSLKQDWDRKKAQFEQAPPARKNSDQEVMIAAQRAFEDAERETKTRHEEIWVDYLKACHGDIYPVLRELAKEKGIDAIHGYFAPFDEAGVKGIEKSAIEHFFRSPNVNLLYLDKAVDLTDELLERLNAKYEAERKDASR